MTWVPASGLAGNATSHQAIESESLPMALRERERRLVHYLDASVMSRNTYRQKRDQTILNEGEIDAALGSALPS